MTAVTAHTSTLSDDRWAWSAYTAKRPIIVETSHFSRIWPWNFQGVHCMRFSYDRPSLHGGRRNGRRTRKLRVGRLFCHQTSTTTNMENHRSASMLPAFDQCIAASSYSVNGRGTRLQRRQHQVGSRITGTDTSNGKTTDGPDSEGVPLVEFTIMSHRCDFQINRAETPK